MFQKLPQGPLLRIFNCLRITYEPATWEPKRKTGVSVSVFIADNCKIRGDPVTLTLTGTS